MTLDEIRFPIIGLGYVGLPLATRRDTVYLNTTLFSAR